MTEVSLWTSDFETVLETQANVDPVFPDHHCHCKRARWLRKISAWNSLCNTLPRGTVRFPLHLPCPQAMGSMWKLVEEGVPLPKSLACASYGGGEAADGVSSDHLMCAA